jgi:hypothetical protein
MKKTFFVIIFLTISSYCVFASFEIWLSGGYEGGFFFENGNYISVTDVNADERINYNGINTNFFNFWNDNNIGMFFKVNMYPPTFRGGEISVFYIQLLFGPEFRYIINESSILNFGIGLTDFQFDSFGNIFIGLAGEVGYKYNISKFIFLNAGLDITNKFLFYTEKNNAIRFGIHPFLNIGVNIFGGDKK